MIRIGMLTSGGDCQALNAAMRGVAKTMYNSNEDVEIYGFLNGYQGLIYGRFRLLGYADFSASSPRAARSWAAAARPTRPSASRTRTAWTRSRR